MSLSKPIDSSSWTQKKRKPLSYHPQVSILRWLPVEVRTQFARRVPSFRKVESTLPFRFTKVKVDLIESSDAPFLGFEELHFCITKTDRPGDKRNLKAMHRKDKDKADTPLWEVETDLTHRELFEAVTRFFFDRPGTTIDRLSTDFNAILRFGDLALWWKVKTICHVAGLDSQHIGKCDVVALAMSIQTPHMRAGLWADSDDIRRCLTIAKESRRAVGYTLDFQHDSPSPEWPAMYLGRIYCKLLDLNPKKGTISRRRTKHVYKRQDVQADVDCVVLEMEHADLVVCLPDVERYEEESISIFEEEFGILVPVVIVEKGSVREREPENGSIRWKRLFSECFPLVIGFSALALLVVKLPYVT